MAPFTGTTQAEELGAGAHVLGLLSLGLCWWFPFGLLLGACGTSLGVASLISGMGQRGFLATALALTGLVVGLMLASDDWSRLLGS